MDHIRSTIQKVYATETPEILQKKGIATFIGAPFFIDAHTITINNKNITARYFLVCTGSCSLLPHLEGLDSVTYLTNETLFDLKKIPSSLIILGGGPIGVELGCALNRLNCSITIVEQGEHILNKEDNELVQLLEKYFVDQGIVIKTGLKAVRVSKNNDQITLYCNDARGEVHEVKAESLFIAIGRKPNNENLNLEKIGVQSTNMALK